MNLEKEILNNMELINYSKCSTCKKAKEYLDNNNINYIDRQIKENNPSFDEIKGWIDKYNINPRKLFNTSGIMYKKMNLKDKLDDMNEDEMIKLLSSDGMLVKRPILVGDDKLLIGFKEKDWNLALAIDNC